MHTITIDFIVRGAYMRNIVIMDGNQAAAYVSYAYSDISVIYPITPSSPMAEWADEWSEQGKKNIYGNNVLVKQMESEAGAAGALHGALVVGALGTTYTSSQGLLLMIPNIYKLAGERLPAVINVAARAISTHALSIFGDHSDIYACRQTGAAIFISSSPQQVMDLSPVAYMTSVLAGLPFLNCFDGFRTSHEIQKIKAWNYDELKQLINMDAVNAFRNNSLNPERACMMGSAQNPDVYFQNRETINTAYFNLPSIAQDCINKINNKLGTKYGLFDYYGDKHADRIIVAMGSVCEVAKDAIDFVNKTEKTGLIEVHLYRPFCVEEFIKIIPETVKRIYVLDRTKEPGSIGEPLYLDVVAALKNSMFYDIQIFHGRYGLASKNTSAAHIIAVFRNEEKHEFTIGINDDVTHLSLDISDEDKELSDRDAYTCLIYGLGGDGTVSACKNSLKIIGNHTDMEVQAYFDYDSKKSRGLTVSHMRFSHNKIRSSCLVETADFLACHNETYLFKYEFVYKIKRGGIFLINCQHDDEWINGCFSEKEREYILENKIRVYAVNGLDIGRKTGLNGKISTILQAAFFKLTRMIDINGAVKYMKEAAKISYGAKGSNIVEMNCAAIDEAVSLVRKVVIRTDIACSEVKSEKGDFVIESASNLDNGIEYFVSKIQRAVSEGNGNELPVSSFMSYQNGALPSGSSAYERRSIAGKVPVWVKENCIQCNRCSFVCPHSVIRPVVLDEKEVKDAPSGMELIKMTGLKEYDYGVVISYTDCTGCGACVAVCPGNKEGKALHMVPADEQEEKNQAYFDYAKDISVKERVLEKYKKETVKGSQFLKPFLEFSGACSGCGETPYVKLLTQLYGDNMFIANATGCSSIWGNSFPSTSYTVNEYGRGPAFASSLFEDNAQYGFGMMLGYEVIRKGLKSRIIKLRYEIEDEEYANACDEWISSYNDIEDNRKAAEKICEILTENSHCQGKIGKECKDILDKKEYLSKKSFWLVGGDGWAYDIGFAGLDHVLASGLDVNILVLDTECYSNTGGQASKATPYGAVAKFQSGGKKTGKKDLAGMAMTYGNVYVAGICMGADYNQTVKVMSEAGKFKGPSIIIAYSTCIAHGIRQGMGATSHEQEKAVRSGHVSLFHYNPDNVYEGKSAFVNDTKEQNMPLEEFHSGEIRFNIK